MLVDCRTFEEGHRVEADLCIVGGGAAGITLAKSLIGSGLTVALLESGGIDPDRQTQELYAGRNIGRNYFTLDGCRTRWFGGSTNCWAGLCRPLDPIDFEQRDAIPHSGWPFDFSTLVPFYERAQKYCQLGPFDYEVSRFTDPDSRPVLPFQQRIQTRLIQVSPPTQFGKVYQDELVAADNVTVYLHGNLVDIDSDPEARHVTGLQAAVLGGPRFRVHAKAYVLACGAIKNTRPRARSARSFAPHTRPSGTAKPSCPC